MRGPVVASHAGISRRNEPRRAATATALVISVVAAIAFASAVARVATAQEEPPATTFHSTVDLMALAVTTQARETGARSFFPKPAEDLDRVYESIASELANQYAVDYLPRTTAQPHHFTPVSVVVDGEPTVRSRTGYVPGN